MEYIPKEIYEKSIENIEKKLVPYKMYYEILSKWFTDEFDGISLESKLMNKGLYNIVIYGMGNLGVILYKSLQKSNNINIKYTIDQNLDDNKIQKYKTVSKVDINFDIDIDGIIITPIYAADAIKKDLNNLYKDKEIKIEVLDEIIDN